MTSKRQSKGNFYCTVCEQSHKNEYYVSVSTECVVFNLLNDRLKKYKNASKMCRTPRRCKQNSECVQKFKFLETTYLQKIVLNDHTSMDEQAHTEDSIYDFTQHDNSRHSLVTSYTEVTYLILQDIDWKKDKTDIDSAGLCYDTVMHTHTWLPDRFDKRRNIDIQYITPSTTHITLRKYPNIKYLFLNYHGAHDSSIGSMTDQNVGTCGWILTDLVKMLKVYCSELQWLHCGSCSVVRNIHEIEAPFFISGFIIDEYTLNIGNYQALMILNCILYESAALAIDDALVSFVDFKIVDTGRKKELQTGGLGLAILCQSKPKRYQKIMKLFRGLDRDEA